jgi:hypothetical protein
VRSSPLIGFCLAAVGGLAACDSGSGGTEKAKTEEPPRKLAGVYPDRFQCDSILSAHDLGDLLGGVAHDLDSASSVPRGVAHPCTYAVTAGGATELWTYDFDCRDNAKQTAAKLFEQYKTGSSDLIEQYDALADAGQVKPTDAGVSLTRPEAAVEVDVGAKGLDHHGQAILFLDDDAPCYVRVVGPGAPHRLVIAQAIAKKLTFANAPMSPRPLPTK